MDRARALENEGWVVPGTRSDIARSGVAIAVRSGLPHPGVSTRSAHPDGAGAFVAHLISPETQTAKRQLGMEAAA
jgi:hypothetical protein